MTDHTALPLTALFEQVFAYAKAYPDTLSATRREIIQLQHHIQNGTLSPYLRRNGDYSDIYMARDLYVYVSPNLVGIRRGPMFIGADAVTNVLYIRQGVQWVLQAPLNLTDPGKVQPITVRQRSGSLTTFGNSRHARRSSLS